MVKGTDQLDSQTEKESTATYVLTILERVLDVAIFVNILVITGVVRVVAAVVVDSIVRLLLLGRFLLSSLCSGDRRLDPVVEHVAFHHIVFYPLRASGCEARRPIERATAETRARNPGSAESFAFGRVGCGRTASDIALVARDGRARTGAVPKASARGGSRLGQGNAGGRRLHAGEAESERRFGAGREVGRGRDDPGGERAFGVGGWLVVDSEGGGLI
jgi:hypothetical protein